MRLCLEEKNLEYKSHAVDLGKLEQHSDAYKKINPQMVVPALVDGDLTLTQSMAILEYLEEKYSEPALLPADPETSSQRPETYLADLRV